MEVWLVWGKSLSMQAADETPSDTGWQAVALAPSLAN